MKRRLLMAPVAAALVAMMMVPAFAGSEVGDEAPVINSGGYLNNKLPVSWERLQGKVILLEAWATT